MEKNNYDGRSKKQEAFWRELRYGIDKHRFAWMERIVSVDDRRISPSELKRVIKVVYVLRVSTKYLKQISTILGNTRTGMASIEPIGSKSVEIGAANLELLLEIKRLIPSAEICKICKPSLSPIF